EDLLLVSVVVLHRNLKLDAFAHTFEIDHLVVEQCFVLVKVLDERDDAAGIVKLVLLFRPLVFDGDEYAFVQESRFAQPLGEDIKAEFRCLENVRVRLEIHSCSAAIGMAGHLKRSGGRTSFVALNVDLTATPNLQIHPFGKRIDDRDTNSVQSTGDFVRLVIKLAAGVQLRHNDLGCGFAFLGHHFGGDTTPVVNDRNGIIDVNNDVNFGTKPGQSLVYGVSDDIVDKVVQ